MPHTPGPWEYGGSVGSNRGYVLAGLKTKGEPLGIKRVAVVAQDPILAGGDPVANGRLIAAAPELLKALQNLVTLAHCVETLRGDQFLIEAEDLIELLIGP